MHDPPRKRLRRIETPTARFLTFSTYRRLPLFSNATLRDHFVDSISTARSKTGFRLIAWVIMPEHVHILLVPTAEVPIPVVLQTMKQSIGQEAIRRWRATDASIMSRILDKSGNAHFWQPGGGFDRNVRSEQELTREVWYIHNNPVKRGLVAEQTDWAWSSARWYAGQRSTELAIDLPLGRSLAELEAWEAIVRRMREWKDGPPDSP